MSGTSLGPDSGANEDLYGKKVSGEEIWAGKVQAPDSAKEMLATLRLPEWYAAAGFRAKWK